MTTPLPRSSGTRVGQFARSTANRLLSQNTSGVTAAHNQASMYSSITGAAGEPRRNPNPRGSSRRFTAESVAMNVQNAKMSRSSFAPIRRSLRSEEIMAGLVALDVPLPCNP